MGASDCELLRDAWLAQPMNACSSAAYVVAAVLVLRRPGGRAGAVALAAVGAGSFVFHGPQPSWAGLLHDGAIALLVAVLLIGVARGRALPPAAVVALTAGIAAYLAGRTGGPLCDPASLVQLHAAWHVLTAVAAGMALAAPSRSSLRR